MNIGCEELRAGSTSIVGVLITPDSALVVAPTAHSHGALLPKEQRAVWAQLD
ncbi:MAG: hypothetical protein ABSA07_04645 [Acidimicrobiales bacterium]|jgi:hypothetical protein